MFYNVHNTLFGARSRPLLQLYYFLLLIFSGLALLWLPISNRDM